MTKAVPFPNLAFQIQHLEAIGIEIKKYFIKHRSSQIRHFQRINPLDRLLEKGLINKQQCAAGKQYQEDFELSNLTNHARMSYSSISTGGGKMAEREIKEAQMIASKNVMIIRELLTSREIAFDRFCKLRKSRKRPKKYLLFLTMFFELGIKLSNISLLLGHTAQNMGSVEKRIVEMAEVMDNYYNN